MLPIAHSGDVSRPGRTRGILRREEDGDVWTAEACSSEVSGRDGADDRKFVVRAAGRVVTDDRRPGESPSDSDAGRGYGSADVAPSGVDRSQLRRNRTLSPTERVEQMVDAVRILASLQEAANRRNH